MLPLPPIRNPVNTRALWSPLSLFLSLSLLPDGGGKEAGVYGQALAASEDDSLSSSGGAGEGLGGLKRQ